MPSLSFTKKTSPDWNLHVLNLFNTELRYKISFFFFLERQSCFSIGCSQFQLLFIYLFELYIPPITIHVRNVKIDVLFFYRILI
jgi:hypothetical protein